MSDSSLSSHELTLRGILLGALITLVFTASNVYLGLKVGMTFASSIPAAVISMAVLRKFKNANILENNIVQTQASAAGCLSAVIFVMPALVMLGYWQGFPYWQTVTVCAAGGIMGVVFSVPLRRAMVVHSTLTYPEGVAAAAILKTGGEVTKEQSAAAHGTSILLKGSLLSALFALCCSGLRVFSGGVSFAAQAGGAVFTLGSAFSFALLGAGLLIGIGGGISLLVGTLLCWGVGVPVLTALTGLPSGVDPEDLAVQLWAQKIRFAGAGCIAIAALWTLVTLFGSIVRGLKESLEISRQAREESVSPQDTDLHIKELTAATLLALLLLAGVLYSFAAASTLSAGLIVLCVITGTLLTAIIGFVLAAACGYMAGLVGSSSSPISGITIISVVLIAVVFMLLSQVTDLMQTPGTRAFITAFTLFTATAVTASCCIANDNLQDLKTGQLVGASPRLQQIALIIGTALGALVIAPVLDLLYQSYGFTGALPRADMDPSLVLSAPQATLMSSIVGGIFNRDLDWFYIGMGLLLGAVIIVISMLLQKYSQGRLSLAPLAVGLGIYLPSDVNVMIVVGALISYLLGRSLQHQKTALQALRERSNLLAAGLIVGESLIGVILAIVLTVSTASGGSASPLALESPLSAQSTQVISLVCFVAGCVYALRLAVRTPRQGA